MKKLLSLVLAAAFLCTTVQVAISESVAAEEIQAEALLGKLTLPYTESGYKIAGNITLPEMIDGNLITWSSSNPEIISTERVEFTEAEKTEYGENYTFIPEGIVTRPKMEDCEVTLTASITIGGKEYDKEFVVIVKKAPEKNYAQMDSDGDFKGYLYVSFIEPPKNAMGQQVYFASSDDGRNWTDLNDNKPVLTSTMGTRSTRDHYIVRSPEGDRFYLIATDLNCFASGGSWVQYATAGSKYLIVWESDDLVNWSEQRMVKIADDDTGCAWAPETIYDELTGEYTVYWSGNDIKAGSETNGKKVVYYSKTRDFYSFTPQQRFVIPNKNDGLTQGTSTSFIDTTMIQGSDGRFYRVTKFEDVSPTQVFMDVADYPLGDFERVQTNLNENAFLGTEGPGWFKYNKDDAESFGAKYCLMLDGYNGPNAGVGFFPTSIADLNGEESFTFTKLTTGFKMRTSAKHGAILPLTQEEYDRVNSVYANTPPADLSQYVNPDSKQFDIAQSYPNYPDGWTMPSEKSLDNNTYHYLGFNGKADMGEGYGTGSDWLAIEFDMAANSYGDNILRDTEGRAITGYCYATGTDGLWVGHGERSYGGTINDKYGVKRLPNYLKTVVGSGSDITNTGHSTYAQHDICTIIITNKTGTVDGYSGDYYTVDTYINGKLLSTEYYSGKVNGIGSIETMAKQYFGNLKIFCGMAARSEDYTIDSISVKGETATVTVSGITGEEVFLIVAAYDTGNVLKAVDFKKIKLTAVSESFDFTLETKGAKYVSAYVWNSMSGINPLSVDYTENLQ